MQNKNRRHSTPDQKPSKIGQNTHWNQVSKSYDRQVGKEGSEYHQEILIPGTLNLLEPKRGEKILDLGCGQGVFCRALSRLALEIEMTGIDAARNLIERAKTYPQEHHRMGYHVMEASHLKGIPNEKFDAIVSILALQNMNPIESVIQEITRVAKKKARMVLILNHPCFRIPRQSSWGFDESNKIQYRRIDRYMSPLEIPIKMHPGSNPDLITLSFHRPLSYYIQALYAYRWALTYMEEWSSHKESEPGARSRAENRARQEIPLFLAIRAERI
ncbi:MAG: class I SAM-dependent methyltransferase [Chlamydiae bacterium]|nr:class I SAM-dependent methyltransferase [Chlamydiota bacterium]MBI3277617.1 class I SAM-dependent methyltransferase [Chlamydiota bacterium]